ncbi:MAG: glycosyltransferase family 4 protein, partial [Planctomycetota bacterium]
MLVILPTALEPSGVVTWAIRLASSLVETGRDARLLLHGAVDGPIAGAIDPRVRVFEHPELPCFDALAGDLAGVIPVYARAIVAMRRGGAPVVVSPNLHADCYGAVAALTQTMGADVRTIGWAHSDNRYDERVLAHYEPVLHAVVGVSEVVRDGLARSMASRSDDVHRIPYGVPVGDAPEERDRDGTLRLVFTGRIEDEQKRATALVYLSRTLERLGVPHELRVVGDGPLQASLERDATASMRWLGTLGPVGVREQLSWGDALVLPSRYEGLSVSMLEAMACGCAPVVTRVRSGVDEAIEHGRSGVIVDVGVDARPEDAGEGMARAIAAVQRDELIGMGRRAHAIAASRYALRAHAERVSALIDSVVRQPPRYWPASRAAAFTSAHAGSGSTPADAPARLRGALLALRGRRVALHGTGQHTRDLASVLATKAGSCVVAFCDD